METVAAIICAAGSSTRMGGIKKEYRLLDGGQTGGLTDGLTVLGAAVSAFAAVPEISVVVITVPAEAETGEAAARLALPPRLLAGESGGDCSPAIHFVSGGATRQASVLNALSALAACPPDYVLIHDGARPWVSPALIRRIIAEVKIHSAVIPLLPLTETPKETDAPLDSANTVFIQRHLKRAVAGAAQTPQAFAFPAIFAAHQRAAQTAVEYTDDAEVWAFFCDPATAALPSPVAAILGEAENRKITFPEDL